MKEIYLKKEEIHKGSLILVNARYGYHDLESDIVTVLEEAPKVCLERRAAVLLTELLRKIHGFGQIVLVSGWRSKQEQQEIWEDSIQQSGEEFTRKFVAVPGYSEHQTGLAIDLGLRQERMDFICPKFPAYGICEIFRKFAAEYGFVERYPKGKEAVTGIGYEPWHFRYVGAPHAMILAEQGLTLEEYTDFLREYPYKKPYRFRSGPFCADISWREAEGEVTSVKVDSRFPYSVSGDNRNGFILTEWRGSYGSPKELRCI